jgi:predicted PurR-regulated permease PerM
MKKYVFSPVSLIVILCVLYVGKPLLMPLVLAIFIWYLINILTDTIAKPLPRIKIGMPRPLAFCASLAIIGGAVYLAAWIITTNLAGVAATLPAYQYNFEQMSRRLFSLIPWGEPITVGNLMAGMDMGSITRIAVAEITNILGRGTIVAVYMLFLFLEQGSFGKKLETIIPNDKRRNDVKAIIARINSDVRAYLGIKTVVSVITALLCYAIFVAVDLKFASFWAFLIFVFNYIPTVGSIISTALPTFFAFMQYESLGPFFVVLIGVTMLQMLIGNVIEPRFQGDRLNLSPLVILISLALWNMIWGIPGMFLCVPLTAIAVIIFSYFPQTRFLAAALSRNGKISRAASLEPEHEQEHEPEQTSIR